MKKNWYRPHFPVCCVAPFILALLFFVPCVFTATAQGITIQFQAADLPDTTPGDNLWQYNYTVSDHTFPAGQGFTIYFDQTLYKDIEDPTPPVNDDWELIVWQPDLVIPDAGAYDALAITAKVDGASLADAFTVRFVWLGEGAPDSQPFEVYQESPFSILESGETEGEPRQPADVNGDNRVNIFDLVLVARDFGETPPDNPAADVNRDGTVNIFDLVLVARDFGKVFGPPPAAPMMVSSPTPPAEIRLTAKRVDADQITVQVHADPSIKLGGFHFGLRFAPKRLSIVEATEGGFFASGGAQSYWLPPKVRNGRLQLAAVAIDARLPKFAKLRKSNLLLGSVALDLPRSSISTDLSTLLAQATFRVNGDFNTAVQSIRIENLQLADREGRAIRSNLRYPVGDTPRVVQNSLLQNFPNPFNPETWIPYALVEGAAVTIHIYDARGYRIRSLKLGFQPAGNYTAQTDAAFWDGRNQAGETVASGVYYYTIRAGNFTATRRMLVVK